MTGRPLGEAAELLVEEAVVEVVGRREMGHRPDQLDPRSRVGALDEPVGELGRRGYPAGPSRCRA